MRFKASPTNGDVKRRSPRSDAGSTFIEVLVSVVLLGVGGVAVLAGMAATLRSASVHDRLATVQSQVADAGDYLTDVTLTSDTYLPCASEAQYQGLVDTWQVSVESVEFWDGSGWDAACSGPSSSQMQKVVLSASADGLERQLVVVKRKATAAVTPGGAWNDGMVSPLPNPGL